MTSLSEKSINNALTRANANDIISFLVPDYSAKVAIEHDLATDYTCENMGYYYCLIDKNAANQAPQIKVNGTQVGDTVYSSTYANCYVFVLCNKGDIISADSAYYRKVRYYLPAKGA